MKLADLFAKKAEKPETAPALPTPPVNFETARKLESGMTGHFLLHYAKTHRLTLAHFAWQNTDGWSPLHFAVMTGHLPEVLEVLKSSGEGLNREVLLLQTASGNTVADCAVGQRHALNEIFNPSLWAHHVGEMEVIAQHLPKEERQKIGYEALRDQAILLTAQAAPKFSAADFARARRGGEGERQENHRLSTRDRT